ncbi:hypothetical protein [Fictibacillus macauensis]|nr:hypothetical protein [Fictibacillus macauensis]
MKKKRTSNILLVLGMWIVLAGIACYLPETKIPASFSNLGIGFIITGILVLLTATYYRVQSHKNTNA